jgi:ankyrin repeat protein
MFIDEKALNPKKVFELPDIKKSVMVDRDSLPDNWLNQLCEGLNKLCNESLITRASLSKHLDGTYTYKASLLDALAFIYQSVKEVKQEGGISDEIKSRFSSLTIRLVDGIEKCTPGFHNRVNSIVLSLQATDKSITNMLFNYRMSLVEKAAHKVSDDVHVINRFYCVGNALGLGVIPLTKQDPYPGDIADEVIEAKLKAMFFNEYTPEEIICYLIEAIQAHFRDKGVYEGRKESGYAQLAYEAWMVSLQNLLGNEYNIDYEVCLSDDDNDNLVDINRITLFHLLSSYLISQKWMLTPLAKLPPSDEEDEFSLFCLNFYVGIRFNDNVLIKKLIEESINSNLIIKERSKALLAWAIEKNQKDVVLTLIDKGVNVNRKDKAGNTALMIAVCEAKTEIALLIIEKGARVDRKNKDGNTALMLASEKGAETIAMSLINKRAKLDSINNDGNTSLMLAAFRGHTEIAFALINKGAKLNEKNADGNTALLISLLQGHTAIALALINRGANIFKSESYGKRLLLIAASMGNKEIALALIKKGAKLDNKNADGNTALIESAIKGNTDIALALIKKGAKLDERNRWDYTALHFAAKLNKREIALALIENGANLDKKDIQGRTPLMLAIFKGNKEIALTLIEKGAHLDERNSWNNTALHLAARFGHAEIALALINKGANLDGINIRGKTALALARESKCLKVVKVLMNAQRNNQANLSVASWLFSFFWTAEKPLASEENEQVRKSGFDTFNP